MPRTAGHWILTSIAICLLALLAGFLWWFGPSGVMPGVSLWALATVPLLLAAFGRTREKLFLGLSGLLLCGPFALAVLSPFSFVDGHSPMLFAVVVTSPVAITVGWIWRLHRPPASRLKGPVVGTVLAGICAFGWARSDLRYATTAPEFAQSFMGCYQVDVGRWVPSRMLGHSARGIIPARIRLDTIRGALAPDSGGGRDGGYAMFERGKLLIRPGWWGSAYWQPVDQERLTLHWNTGYHGVTIRLRRRRDGFRGMAEGHSDVVGYMPAPRAAVRAHAIDCELVGPDTGRRAPPWRDR